MASASAGALFPKVARVESATLGRMAETQLQSTLTCPNCGHQATEQMPTDACVVIYACKGCGEELKPLPGDCCVFCSYGSMPCLPVQEARASTHYDRRLGDWRSGVPGTSKNGQPPTTQMTLYRRKLETVEAFHYEAALETMDFKYPFPDWLKDKVTVRENAVLQLDTDFG